MAATYFSLAGLLLDILGVALLLNNEILTRRREVAEESLPLDFFTKHLDAVINDKPVRPNSESENAYEKASGAVLPNTTLSKATFAAVLIMVGFALQAVGVLLG